MWEEAASGAGSDRLLAPVEEQELLLVACSAQAGAELHAVVTLGAGPSHTGDSRASIASAQTLYKPERGSFCRHEPVEGIKEGLHGLAADVHHFQDQDDVVPRHDLRGTNGL